MTVRTIALFSRRPGMSFAQFDDYWRETHAPLAAKVPGVVQYIQRHVVPQGDAGEPDNAFGIDGIAVLDYESAEAMEAGWASPDGQKALDDVPNFLGQHYVVVLEDYVVVPES
ncbi:EthD family reductase [Williamsia muralis]|uniref:EthD family reductase n=1 Tax=Williamsia marianensis TaxID=85044 RepID=UPI00381E1469